MSQRGPTDFTRNVFDWLAQVCADPTLSAHAFKLAYVISQHVNRETGDAWPSQKGLAETLRTTDRGVRKLASALIAGGHLEVTEGRGRGHTNRYRMLVKSRNDGTVLAFQRRNEGSAIDGQSRNDGSCIEPVKEEQSFPLSVNKSGTAVPKKRNGCSEKSGTGVPKNHLIEPSEEPMPQAAQNSAIAASDFRPPELPAEKTPKLAPRAELYRRGKEVLGSNSGGMITKLIALKGGNIPLARAALEMASVAGDPKDYVGGILNKRDGPDDLRAKGYAW